MNVVPALVICSLFLALCAVVLFVWSSRRGDLDHADRLSLLPLDDDLTIERTSPSEPSVKD